MAPASRNPWWSELVRSRLFLVIGAGVVLFVGVAFVREAVHRYEVHQEIARLQGQIGDLESKQKKLTDLIDYFSSPLFQEQEARQKLGKAKPGESVVIIPAQNENTNTTTAPDGNGTTQTAATVSIPVRWWRYFFAS